MLHHDGIRSRSFPADLPGLLRQAAVSSPRSRHLGWRTSGYWRWLSTEEVAREVRRAALGLHALGVRPGCTVGLVGPSSPQWLIADLAILSLGAVTVPLFPNLADEHAVHEIGHSRLRALLCLGDEGAAFAQRHCRLLGLVVERDATVPPRGAIGWEVMCRRGDELGELDPGLYPGLSAATAADRLATIIYTSGSTGMPKGVELTHGALLSQVEAALRLFPLDPARDRALSCLPLAHVFERMVAYAYLAAGIPVWFADDVRQAGQLMREARPTIMTMVPRLAEKLYDRIAQGVDAAWVGRRALGRWALDQAERGDPDTGRALGLRLSDGLVFRRVRAALGGCLRQVIVGGAALDPRFERFLRNIGVALYPGYGLTEAGPVVACNGPQAQRTGSVGRPFPGVSVRIAVGGEIEVDGPGVMRGYHRDPAATAATRTSDGWLRTGDLGAIDADGFLRITGRIKELCKTANGKYVSPVPIESALQRDASVDHACVVADGRPYVAAILFLSEDAVRLHASDGLPDAELRAALDRLVGETNAHLDAWMQVRRWVAVPHPAAIGHELTPTLKLRRGAVIDRYRDLVDRLYAGGGAA